MPYDRRKFLKDVSSVTAGAGLAASPLIASAVETPSSKKITSAADRVNVALIGCNGMGFANLRSMLNTDGVECVAICDVDQSVISRRTADLEKLKGKKPQVFTDYRKLLDNKDVDAVIIGTPDHWHCLQMIHACQAGKDVYVEKPIANSISECNQMVEAKNRYNRVVQVGQWQRSDPHWIGALDYLRTGALGKIRLARTWAYVGYGRDFSPKPDAPVPAGVDYDMWLGPAPKRPFNPYRFHGSFRYFWDYAGGLMTDWGVHMIDMVLAGMNVSVPTRVHAMGGKLGYPDSAIETPDTLQTLFDFGTFTMLWEQAMGAAREPYNRGAGQPGVAFIGNNGTLVIDRENWDLYPEMEEGKYLTQALPTRHSYANGLDAHTKNFVECVRSRKQPNCTIEMGRNAAVTAQLGNISYRLKRAVSWDDKKNSIIGDTEADAMTRATYREPWKL
jgi:predicted dehydrogenase